MGGHRNREQQRARARELRRKYGPPPKCPQCGARDSHFVPPGAGDPGFFICEADTRFRGRTLAEGVLIAPQPTCGATNPFGSRCVLEVGHPGVHSKR